MGYIRSDPRSAMRSFLPALLFLLAAASLSAQTPRATLEVTPQRQTAHPSQAAIFTITVIPEGGFSAPIYLSISSPTLQTGGALNPTSLDQPKYGTGARITITPTTADIGNHMIFIEGKNGALRIYDTCYLEVTGRVDPAWTVYAPWSSQIPDSTVNGIIVDRNDVGWLATRRGLVRFDRTSWTIYDSTNSSLPFSWITAIAADSNGAIWVGGATVDSGSTVWDPKMRATLGQLIDGVWAIHDPSNSSLEGRSVKTIAADAEGSIWVGTDTGMVQFDGATWTRYYHDALLAPPIYFPNVISIAIDRTGNLWALSRPPTGPMLMQKFDGQFWTPIDMDQMYPQVARLVVDPKNQTWLLAGEKGIAYVNGAKLKRQLPNYWLYPGGKPTSMAFGPGGITWIGSAMAGQYPYISLGAYYMETWHTYSPASSGLPDGTVLSLAVDSRGLVWIGTAAFGLVIYDPSLDDISGVERPVVASGAISSVHPNPTAANATVTYRLRTPAHLRVALYNSRGAELRTLLDEARIAGEGRLTLATIDLPSGLYFVRVSSGANTETWPLVVNR
jgi:Two component regulator propeller